MRAAAGVVCSLLVGAICQLAVAQTFSHDVAPLLYKKCATCHRTGGVAHFL